MHSRSCLVLAGLISACGAARVEASAEVPSDERSVTELLHCWRPAAPVDSGRFCFTEDRVLWRFSSGERWQQALVRWRSEGHAVFSAALEFDGSAQPTTYLGWRPIDVTLTTEGLLLEQHSVRGGSHMVRVSVEEEQALLGEVARVVHVRALCERARMCAEVFPEYEELPLLQECSSDPEQCMVYEPLESTSNDCLGVFEDALRVAQATGTALPEECESPEDTVPPDSR